MGRVGWMRFWRKVQLERMRNSRLEWEPASPGKRIRGVTMPFIPKAEGGTSEAVAAKGLLEARYASLAKSVMADAGAGFAVASCRIRVAGDSVVVLLWREEGDESYKRVKVSPVTQQLAEGVRECFAKEGERWRTMILVTWPDGEFGARVQGLVRRPEREEEMGREFNGGLW